MCGRFVNLNKASTIKKIFEIKSPLNEYNLSYNIAPSQFIQIVTNNKKMDLEYAKWGYTFLDKESNLEKNIINSRLETIKDKILFKESFYKRKCIIPANGYFEWPVINNDKIPHFVHVPEADPIYFAGIWKYLNFKNNSKKIFSIITKSANKYIEKIHHRMPVLLSIEEAKDYLYDDTSSYLKNNFVSKIEEYLEYYAISKFVNSPLNNSKKCIDPVDLS